MEEVADGSAGQAAKVQVGDIVRGTTARSKVNSLEPIIESCSQALPYLEQ